MIEPEPPEQGAPPPTPSASHPPLAAQRNQPAVGIPAGEGSEGCADRGAPAVPAAPQSCPTCRALTLVADRAYCLKDVVQRRKVIEALYAHRRRDHGIAGEVDDR